MSRLIVVLAVATTILAVPVSAQAATFYVNQSDPDAYDHKFINGNPQVNLCFNPDVPCKTIVYAEDRADGADGNEVRVLPDPSGTADFYYGNVEVGNPGPPAHAVRLVGAGSAQGGTQITGTNSSPPQALRLVADSSASTLAVVQPYANGVAIVDAGAGRLENVSATAALGTAYSGSGVVLDSVLDGRDGSDVAGVAARVLFLGRDFGLTVNGYSTDPVQILDSVVRPISNSPTSVGVRVQSGGSHAAADLRHVTVLRWATQVKVAGDPLSAALRAANSSFAGGAGATDLAISGPGTTVDLDRVNRSPSRTVVSGGATLADTAPLDVDGGFSYEGHLSQGSPLVDRGTVGGILAGHPLDTLDQDRQPRVQGAAPDVGADELPPGGDATTPASPPSGTSDPSPVVTGLALAPATFRLGAGLPRLARKTPTGTTVRFTLTEAAQARITFSRRLAGRRSGRRCRRPSRALRRHKRCTRLVAVRGAAISVSGKQGRNRLRFAGRLSRRLRLKPGLYRLALVATDSAGQRSAPRRANFKLLPALSRRR